MFFKLIDDTKIQRAPNPLKINGKDVFTNSESIHNQQGFYELVVTEYPQDDKYYISKYAMQNNKIIQNWVEVEMPEENESEAVDIV